MNIIKERIKLNFAYPTWRSEMKKIKHTNEPKILLMGTPVHGNLGDHAIAIKEKEFLKSFFFDYEIFEILMPLYHIQKKQLQKSVRPQDLIIISGGGWMGNLWIENEKVIREIVTGYPDNKIVIFPQTAYYTEDKNGEIELEATKKIFAAHNNLRIFVRDEKSYDLIKNKFKLYGSSFVEMVPDMVLYGKGIPGNKIKLNNIINVCLRNDCEAVTSGVKQLTNELENKYEVRKVSTVIKSPISLKKRKIALYKSWKEFRSAKLTITDRLHAMLFSIINGTPCLILDNKTGKVFGVAKWLEDTGMVTKAYSEDQMVNCVDQCLCRKHEEYSYKKLMPYFVKMAEEIRKD